MKLLRTTLLVALVASFVAVLAAVMLRLTGVDHEFPSAVVGALVVAVTMPIVMSRTRKHKDL